MKISARNQMAGIVRKIRKGPISSVITLEIAKGLSITAQVTSDAVRELKLKPGTKATAIIKASSILLGVE